MSEPIRERIIVSVGGSLIVPDDIDVDFLRNFRTLILEKVSEGYSFYIITGGGKVCRKYQTSAKEAYEQASRNSLDWIGIASTRLNAELLRALFDAPPVIRSAEEPVDLSAPILVAGGMRLGNSSDWAAVEVAKVVGANKLVNLSNIDYVYTADPHKDPGAQKIEKIRWEDFRKLIPDEWEPGLSSPFDPIAAKEAEATGLEVAVINGAYPDRLVNYLSNKPFIGTLIT